MSKQMSVGLFYSSNNWCKKCQNVDVNSEEWAEKNISILLSSYVQIDEYACLSIFLVNDRSTISLSNIWKIIFRNMISYS